MLIAELSLSLLLSAAFAQEASTAPRLKARPAPTPGEFAVSPDGRFRWIAGDKHINVRPAPNKPERKVALPPLEKKSIRRKMLFAERSPLFLIIDEEDQEVGLHLKTRRGAEKAKALLLASTLRLLDSEGRVLWTRRMQDKAIVGKSGDARALSVANDGTVAVLLQDVDPYAKARPYIHVFDPKGREVKSLDYTKWTRVDELLLSPDGKALMVRGFGLVPEDGEWSKAFGYYPTRADKEFLIPAPKSPDERQLRGFDSLLWACCIKESGQLSAVTSAGARQALTEEDARKRFGPPPTPSGFQAPPGTGERKTPAPAP
ncbi:MAG TPA: hypothetical protein DCM05_05835 [Elusimicrobia bacterium]|nr:hypothetical protein [Elusimicrobiota bacterium]